MIPLPAGFQPEGIAEGPHGSLLVGSIPTGADVAVLQATDDPNTFVNDVVVTRGAAYFTDSYRPVFYRLPLRANGQIAGAIETVALSGDFGFVPGDFNSNGIVASANGKTLLIVNSVLAELYRVNPATGAATRIQLTGDGASNGDGMLLCGRT